MKKFLFVLTKPPHGSASTRESTDTLMAACAFGQDVTVLALGEGLYQFLKSQSPNSSELKDTAAMLESLPLYGVESIVATQEDLASLRISQSDLILPATVINEVNIAEHINSADVILSY